ncbi:hypothetical protein D3C73_1075830 [compost metagenome]
MVAPRISFCAKVSAWRDMKRSACFCRAMVTRCDSDRKVSSSRVRKALTPLTLFRRSASKRAKSSVTVFSGVFVVAPLAPASIPPCPASTATVKTPSSMTGPTSCGGTAAEVFQSCDLRISANCSLLVISASSTSRKPLSSFFCTSAMTSFTGRLTVNTMRALSLPIVP